MNVLLTEDGQHYQHTKISGGRSLVINIGGFTTDYLAVNPDGEVDYNLARSVSCVGNGTFGGRTDAGLANWCE